MNPSQIADRYTISGTRAGQATFTRNGLFYDVTIEYTAGKKKMPPVYGLAMLVGSRLAIAVGPRDKMEIGAYSLNGDHASSLWVPPAAKGDSLAICGREKLVRQSASTWKIEEAVAIDNSTYAGRIEIAPIAPGIISMTWHLDDGEFASFALQFPDAYLSCWNLGDPGPHGIMALDPTPSGFEASGIMKGDSKIAHETWTAA